MVLNSSTMTRAVIEFDYDVKFNADIGGGKESTIELICKELLHRSLKTGIDVKTALEGRARLTHPVTEDGVDLLVEVTANVKGESTSKVK